MVPSCTQFQFCHAVVSFAEPFTHRLLAGIMLESEKALPDTQQKT
jgi:hypothetical protein